MPVKQPVLKGRWNAARKSQRPFRTHQFVTRMPDTSCLANFRSRFAAKSQSGVALRWPPQSKISAGGLFELVNPTLNLLLNLRPKSEGQDGKPEQGKNQKPRDQRPKIILPRFVVPDERPDDNHHHADARQRHDEQREHPKPE
jgi:hypothetical protein